ncbi:MAG: EAL domain-containing protein, partial [Nitrospira sp.]|nr:EAL domain-containing protein [Nitrospira sp.]
QAELICDADGTPARMVGTVQDITDRKRTEEQIHRLAHYDGLTNLPNRRLFQDRLERALASTHRRQKLLAVLLLNLDQLKRVNDTFGPTGGDLVLRSLSERLLACIRQSDSVMPHSAEEGSVTVSRLGGDEFTILLTDIGSPQDSAKVARRILAALACPFPVGDQEVFLTGSLGISLAPSDGTDADSLLKNAGTAMNHAKKQGRNTYQFYAQDMNAAALQRLTMENALRKALGRDEFELYYQPQVDIRRWQIIGVEALIRWRHPDLGLVPPAQFIPLAEETGLIAPIGEWVLRTACTHHKAWLSAGLPPIRMSVNLSSLQFDQPDLCDIVQQILRNTAMPPECLDLELTEGILMRDAAATIKTLQRLKQLGLALAIDDFGTGYSSLSYLKRFPLDTLKIDRAFIRDVTNNADDAAITTAIIAMAHSLKLRVMAEGVETDAQLAFLREQGCDELQGYLVSKPIPAQDLPQFLRAPLPAPSQEGIAALSSGLKP